MADEVLPFSVIKKFIVLADYYNSDERIMEEISFWYEDGNDAFINEIDTSYVQILNLRRGKKKKKTSSNEINSNYSFKLLTLKQAVISLHCTLNNIASPNTNTKTKQIKIHKVDHCILYYIRGKLKGLPSRIHLQLIMYGYTPHKNKIIEISKHINDYMATIEQQNKLKTLRKSHKLRIDNSDEQQLREREDAYKQNHGGLGNKNQKKFVDEANMDWTPPMSVNTLFYRLSLCSDRTKHRLDYEKRFDEISMVCTKSKEELFNDAMKIIGEKIRIKPKNDWYQTPYHGHPVYIAMHATASCCRICLGQWYNISEKGTLTIVQMKYIADIIMKWIDVNCPKQLC